MLSSKSFGMSDVHENMLSSPGSFDKRTRLAIPPLKENR